VEFIEEGDRDLIWALGFGGIFSSWSNLDCRNGQRTTPEGLFLNLRKNLSVPLGDFSMRPKSQIFMMAWQGVVNQCIESLLENLLKI
jgi:hypothetical protein